MISIANLETNSDEYSRLDRISARLILKLATQISLALRKNNDLSLPDLLIPAKPVYIGGCPTLDAAMTSAPIPNDAGRRSACHQVKCAKSSSLSAIGVIPLILLHNLPTIRTNLGQHEHIKNQIRRWQGSFIVPRNSLSFTSTILMARAPDALPEVFKSNSKIPNNINRLTTVWLTITIV